METPQGHEWKHGVHIKSNARNVEHYTWMSLFGGLQGGAKGGGVLAGGTRGDPGNGGEVVQGR